MPASKKGSKKGASKKGAGKKSAGKKAGAVARPPVYGYDYTIQPLYGRPIYDAIARGDATELRNIRSAAQKQVKDIQTALAKLDTKLGK
jgi:hypothetical protein